MVLRNRRRLLILVGLAGAIRADRGRRGRRRAAAGVPTHLGKAALLLEVAAGKIGRSNPGGSPAGEVAAKVVADGKAHAEASLAKAGEIGVTQRNDQRAYLAVNGRIGALQPAVELRRKLRMRKMIILAIWRAECIRLFGWNASLGRFSVEQV